VRTQNKTNLSAIIEERRREFDALPARVIDPRHKKPVTKRDPLWRRLFKQLTRWRSRR
jgi:hypothetical protein